MCRRCLVYLIALRTLARLCSSGAACAVPLICSKAIHKVTARLPIHASLLLPITHSSHTIRRLTTKEGFRYPIPLSTLPLSASHLANTTLAVLQRDTCYLPTPATLFSKPTYHTSATMPSSKVFNGAQSAPPRVVEVRPRDLAPSTPSPPSSPKAVRFAPSSAAGISRPLNSAEEWSFWHFENHASRCKYCYDPYRLYRKQRSLCPTGKDLAQDLACHVYLRDGEVYSTRKEEHKLVRVEMKSGYYNAEGLLKSMSYHLPGPSRSRPVVSYDPTPSSARYRERERTPERREHKKETVIVEPASSKPARHSSHRGSKHKSKRYDTVVVQDDVEAPQPAATNKYKERRGSLYESDIARQKRQQGYRVEVREPRRRDRDDRGKEVYE